MEIKIKKVKSFLIGSHRLEVDGKEYNILMSNPIKITSSGKLFPFVVELDVSDEITKAIQVLEAEIEKEERLRNPPEEDDEDYEDYEEELH